MEHNFQCKKGVLFFLRHNDVADEWGALCDAALIPKLVTHELLINYGVQSSYGRNNHSEETLVGQDWGKET